MEKQFRGKHDRRRKSYISPDGGFGWFVVLGAAIVFFIGAGFAKSFTLVFQQLLDKFDKGATATAWVQASNGLVKMLMAPLCSMFCNKFSCRTSVLVGTIFIFLGTILSAFPVNLQYLYFSYGIIAGFGAGLVFTPCFIIIGLYFDLKKARAMSIATLGAGLGGIAFPPMLEKLFSYYSYTGTILIVSGLMLNYAVAALLFRPVLKVKLTSVRKLEEMNRMFMNDYEEEKNLNNSIVSEKLIKFNDDEEDKLDTTKSNTSNIELSDKLKKSRKIKFENLDENKPRFIIGANDVYMISESETEDDHHHQQEMNKFKFSPESLRRFSMLKITKFSHTKRRSTIANIYNTVKDERNNNNNNNNKVNCDSESSSDSGKHNFAAVVEVDEKDEEENKEEFNGDIEEECIGLKDDIDKFVELREKKKCNCNCSLFTQYFDLTLIKDAKFLSFSLLMMTSFLCFTVSTMFFSELARECGLKKVEVALALSLSSIVDIPSRLASGFVFDLPLIRQRRVTFYVLIGALTGLSTSCLPLAKCAFLISSKKIVFCSIWTCYTIFSGITHTQQHTVLTDLAGSRSKTLSSALGLNRLFQGIGGMIGPSIGGLLTDWLGTYTYSYVVAGFTLMFMAFFYLTFVYYLNRKEKREEMLRNKCEDFLRQNVQVLASIVTNVSA